MTSLAARWVALATTPLVWLSATLLIYLAAQWAYERSRLAWLNPVLTSIAVVAALLLLTRTPYSAYFEATRFIHFLLGPATVALAVPLYERIARLRHMLGPVTVGLALGGITAILSAVAIGRALGASRPTLLSLAPKSVTTAIAMGVSEKIGGIPSLTAVLVILTGIIGAISADALFRLLRIHDDSIRGFAIGLASHGIGTTRAFQMSAETGAFSGLGMGLNGVFTALVLPLLVDLVGGLW